MTAVRPLRDLIVARLRLRERVSNEKSITRRLLACLVSPTRALTCARPFVSEGPVEAHLLLSPGGEQELSTVPASVAWIDTASDLVMLDLVGQARVPLEDQEILAETLPERGSRWDALIWDSADDSSPGRLVAAEGEVLGLVSTKAGERLHLRMADPPEGPFFIGAPVFSDGRVFGLISDRGPDGTNWYAIPVTAIRQAIQNHEGRAQSGQFQAQNQNSAPPQPPRVPSDLFLRLSESSRRALQHADGMRRAMRQDKVHMEHLILALYEKDNGPTQREMKRVGVDEGELRKRLGEIAETPLPAFGSYRVHGIDQLPPVSAHVAQALDSARNVAEEHQSDKVQSRHLLYGVISVRECRAVKWLLDRQVDQTQIDMAAPPSPGAKAAAPDDADGVDSKGRAQQRARVAPDLPDGDDLLDVRREVQAICAVIASSETSPPLSIGLFGDWGTGKSFFMNRMEERIDRLKQTARAKEHSAYCRNIVQLRFNAWHYMDTDLWASLAAEIFEGLARALEEDAELLDGQSSPTAARARLLAATSHLRGVREKAEQRKAEANAALHESEQRLKTLDQDEQNVLDQLRTKQLVKAAYRFVAGEKKTAEAIDKAAKDLGISNAQALATDTRATFLELQGLFGGAKAVLLSLRSGSAKLLIWLLATFVLVLTSAALLLQFSDQLAPKIAAAIALIASFLTSVKKVIGPARTALATIAEARAQSQELIDETRKKRETELQNAYEAIRQRANAEEATITRVTQEIAELEQQLEALRADRQMAKFVRAKQESTDYTQHFGVIARARNDFQQLTDLLRRVAEESKTDGRQADGNEKRPPIPKIDRIILYIDDLDRCPEAKVVDVLQAVHLLLAFPLFIVVVGVDSRWLLHSLRQHASVFKTDGEEDDGMDVEERVHWQSTPFNYLEKIFQIPFNLRPMERAGFTALVDSLTISRDKEKTAGHGHGAPRTLAAAAGASSNIEGNQLPAPPPAGNAQPVQPAGGEMRVVQPVAVAAQTIAQGAQDPNPAAQTGPGTAPEKGAGEGPAQVRDEDQVDPNPPYLDITAAERRFMYTTYRLIPTPRAAKRYVNVYRLLRASLPDQKREELEDETRGGFRRVLLMLAMLTGFPQEGTVILRELVERGPEGNWWPFVDQIAREYIERGGQPTRSGNERPGTEKSASPRPNSKNLSAQDATAANSETEDRRKAEERQRAQRWEDLITLMRKVRVDIGTELGQEPQCEEFYRWARQVARYSFEAGRVAGVDESPQSRIKSQRPGSQPSAQHPIQR